MRSEDELRAAIQDMLDHPSENSRQHLAALLWAVGEAETLSLATITAARLLTEARRRRREVLLR